MMLPWIFLRIAQTIARLLTANPLPLVAVPGEASWWRGTASNEGHVTMLRSAIFLIHPSSLCREGMKQLLSDSHYEVVGEAPNPWTREASDAQLLITELQREQIEPDVIRILRTDHPNARLVILASTYDWPQLAVAFQAGVAACLQSDIGVRALKQALSLVMMGETVFPSNVANLLLEQEIGFQGNPQRPVDLSEAERRLLGFILKGDSNKMIAQHLNCPEAKVKYDLRRLLRRLALRNRTSAAVWAQAHGLATAAPLQDQQACAEELAK